jgi:hypothetical protein
MTTNARSRTLKFAILIACTAIAVTTAQTEKPETVMITLRAKPGAESSLARVIERHWETVRRLHLVIDAPHVTLRGTESGGKTYFVEIMTWRDASIPDSAPVEILAIWKEMNDLVEARGGPGLEITEMSVIAK